MGGCAEGAAAGGEEGSVVEGRGGRGWGVRFWRNWRCCVWSGGADVGWRRRVDGGREGEGCWCEGRFSEGGEGAQAWCLGPFGDEEGAGVEVALWFCGCGGLEGGV